ncbi:MAG: tetratricopeptide repeat protein [Candidatus Gastranaerophilales bacterium]|nr:tetratricopeptide repeat protein [Candidatus Gastranaerophilales bacterium]
MRNKFSLLIIFASILLFSGCEQNLSNLDVQKLNEKAQVYMEQGEYDKAIARLESVIDLNDTLYQPYYNLGIAYNEKKDYKKSIEALDKAIKLKPDFSDAYYARSISYESAAFAIINGEEDENSEEVSSSDKAPELTIEQKAFVAEYFEKSKADLNKYIEILKDPKDASEVKERILQLEKDIEKYKGNH